MGVLTAGNGWGTLIGAIIVYEVACAEDELLSRGLDRLLVKHPVWPRIAVLAVALHLINWLPNRFDPVSWLFHVTRLGGRRGRIVAWAKLSRRKAARKSFA